MSPETIRRALLWLGLVTWLFGAGPASAQPTPVERSDDELLILELRLGSIVLHDALLAYLDNESLLLPLSELVAALELPIEVSPGDGVAEGWFLRENRRFSLDLARREVQVEGTAGTYDETLVELHSDDIYVAGSLLERWFPIDLDLDLRSSRIVLRSREKLPIEEKIERRRTWDRLQGRPGRDGPGYPDEPLPYRPIDWPALDARLQSTFQDSSGGSRRIHRAHLQTAGDLFFMSSELSLTLQDGEAGHRTLSEARLKIGRSDPEGGLLGRLGATELKIGDILSRQRPLVSSEIYGRGVELSNFPLDRPEEFDRTTVRGDALPGWQAELYHNGELIDVADVGDDGLYEFVDVPLYIGLNLLRVAIYGPQGQRRERIQRVLIDADLIREGESFYRVGLLQHGERLLPGATEILPGGPVPGNESGFDPRGELRLFAEWERGLPGGVSLKTHIQSLPLEDARHTYGGLSLLTTRRGVFGQLDLAADVDGGWAGRLAAEGNLPGTTFRFEHRRFSSFVSEEATVADPPVSSSALQVDVRLRQPRPGSLRGDDRRGKPRWPLRLSMLAADGRQRSGDRQSTWTGRLSTSWKRLSITQSLELRRRRRLDVSTNSLSSSLLLSGRWKNLRVRGGGSYRWRPEPRLTDVTVTADRRWNSSLSSRFHLLYSLDDQRPSQVSANLSRRFRTVALSADLGYEAPPGAAPWDGGGALRAGVSITVGLRRRPFSGGFQTTSRSATHGGAVAARAFLDNNLDGRFDAEHDEVLEGVKFNTIGGGRPAHTDAEGQVLISGLEAHRRLQLELDEGSLEDPYWVPIRRGLSLLPRPGRTIKVDFPVAMSGELDGTVFLDQSDKRIPISKVRLQLVDADGEVVQETTSAYDGFYLFDKIPPGDYRLRLEQDQRHRLGLQPLPIRNITIGHDGTLLTGIDLLVSR